MNIALFELFDFSFRDFGELPELETSGLTSLYFFRFFFYVQISGLAGSTVMEYQIFFERK